VWQYPRTLNWTVPELQRQREISRWRSRRSDRRRERGNGRARRFHHQRQHCRPSPRRGTSSRSASRSPQREEIGAAAPVKLELGDLGACRGAGRRVLSMTIPEGTSSARASRCAPRKFSAREIQLQPRHRRMRRNCTTGKVLRGSQRPSRLPYLNHIDQRLSARSADRHPVPRARVTFRVPRAAGLRLAASLHLGTG